MELLELFEVQGLGPVGQGFVRFGMDFDHDALGAGDGGGKRHGRHQGPLARGVAGIEDDRQV